VVGALPWHSRRDPAASILRARYSELEPTPEALDAIRADIGLDGNPLLIAARWWGGVVRGDLGESWVSGTPVGPGVVDALAVSAVLALCAMAVALVVATALSIRPTVAVVRGGSVRPPGSVGVALTALPEFLLASGLLVVFGVLIPVLPPFGWSTPAHVVAPALALGLPAGGLLGRLIADAVVSTAGERWVDAWLLVGAPRRFLALAVLRRAAATVVDQAGLVFIGLLGGAVAVERVFAVPGIGRLLLGSATAQDIPSLQAGLLLVTAVAVTIGALTALFRRLLHGGPLPPGALAPPPEPVRNVTRARWTLAACLAIMLAILVLGLPRDPYLLQHERLEPPSLALPMGADASGRDLLARVAHGTLATLGPSVVVVACATLFALIAGFAGRAVRGPVEIANATPPIIAGAVVAAVAGPSVLGAGLAVMWVSWPPMALHTEALVEEARAAPHIRWLPLSGLRSSEIAVLHVVPMIGPPLVRHALLRLPGVALAMASLGFLGLGAPPPTPDWGLLLAEGIGYVERAPWATAGPAGTLVLASLLAVSAAFIGPVGPRQTRSRPVPPRPERSREAVVASGGRARR
jgi:peptide/nickel transport system permease protein